MEEAPPDQIRLSVDEYRDLALHALGRIGYAHDEAAIVAEHVLDAALCGYDYSGVPKILNIAEHPQLRKARTQMRVRYETPVSTLYDGGNNVGMVTMYHVTQTAIAKAQAHGFAVVGVNNSWESGRGAHYVEMVARENLIGIHPLSATPRVAPPGGAVAAFGTNPLAVAFPTQRDPFVIDIGTSAFMFTDLIFRIRRGEQLPDGVAIDAQGKPTRDPAAARKGALLSFGGHRGFALAMAMQGFGILAGAGADFDKTHGFLMIAVKPDLLMPIEDYRRDMTEMLDRIKATPRQEGVDEIRLPSERSFRERRIRMREGVVLDRSIYDALKSLSPGGLPARSDA